MPSVSARATSALSADEHMCKANNVYKFRKGSHYGDVDLSDQKVWVTSIWAANGTTNPAPGCRRSGRS